MIQQIVYIVNRSTLISDNDVNSITMAINSILPKFCDDWQIKSTISQVIGKDVNFTIPSVFAIMIYDSPDIENALGYHTEENGIPYGKVFVKAILDNGGVILYDGMKQTVGQTISHEVFEMLYDPYCNIWWQSALGPLYAGEVADPVQGNILKTSIISADTHIDVGLSDWILPAWIDPQNVRGPFNHMQTLKAPFTIDKNGYVMLMKAGKTTYVFGELVPLLIQEIKQQSPRFMLRNKYVN